MECLKQIRYNCMALYLIKVFNYLKYCTKLEKQLKTRIKVSCSWKTAVFVDQIEAFTLFIIVKEC